MGVSISSQIKLRQIEELKNKMNECSRKCATISEILKMKGIDVKGLESQGLSSEDLALLGSYFTLKNEQVSCLNNMITVQNDERSFESSNMSYNAYEKEKQFRERQIEEDKRMQNKIMEEKAQIEKSNEEKNNYEMDLR